MSRTVLAILVGVLLSVASCGDSKPPAPVDAASCAAVGTKAFGEACANSCECASLFCFTFGDGSSSCTLACSSNTECPSGSMGQKCNGMGACRP